MRTTVTIDDELYRKALEAADPDMDKGLRRLPDVLGARARTTATDARALQPPPP